MTGKEIGLALGLAVATAARDANDEGKQAEADHKAAREKRHLKRVRNPDQCFHCPALRQRPGTSGARRVAGGLSPAGWPVECHSTGEVVEWYSTPSQVALNMDTLNNLLDNARNLCSPSTDAALAVKLGVSKSAVSLWRKGGQITEKHLTALIEFAKADARLAVVVLAEQATTKQERSVWGAITPAPNG